MATDKSDRKAIDAGQLLSESCSYVIKSPPQFGLTCLSHHLALIAWQSSPRQRWIRLDVRDLRPTTKDIRECLASEARMYNSTIDKIDCVVVDSWNSQMPHAKKIIETICSVRGNARIVVMETVECGAFSEGVESFISVSQVKTCYLWTLTRTAIRQIVSSYNRERLIGEDNAVLNRVLSDIDVLNLHRTPLNCLTLLKVSEAEFDESPVNRCEMIHRVLFLLFNEEIIPTYKTRPDLKDCEYILGYFCETMLRSDNYCFSRSFFISTLRDFCSNQFIDLDVEVVFDVLCHNLVIVNFGGYEYTFRFSFWIFYFSAQRMVHNEEFRNYIFEGRRYANYPEIMEFYTGVDRRRDDALEALLTDLREIRHQVESKINLPSDFDPYTSLEWSPSETSIERMRREITDGVRESNLPDQVKDEFADMGYDSSKPYTQSIGSILDQYSFQTSVG